MLHSGSCMYYALKTKTETGDLHKLRNVFAPWLQSGSVWLAIERYALMFFSRFVAILSAFSSEGFGTPVVTHMLSR